MKLEYYRGKEPNFGDELNPWMWPQLLPDFFDEDEQAIFLGVGSIIDEYYDKVPSKKIVFGSGYVPEYSALPDLAKNWDIICVRGPRTAQALNLPLELAICDSGILARTLFNFERKHASHKVSFMPHVESLGRGNWQDVCQLAGINFIDPRAPVIKVMEAIASSKIVIAEAMHGVIIADAFRVPWIPVLPIDALNRGKWSDWAESLEVKFTFKRLWPSTLNESQVAFERRPFLASIAANLEKTKIDKLVNRGLADIAARRITNIARSTSFLSKDKNIIRATDRLLTSLSHVKKHYRKHG